MFLWFKCMYIYFPKQMPIHELCILADQSAALCPNCELVELCQRDCVLTSQHQVYTVPLMFSVI